MKKIFIWLIVFLATIFLFYLFLLFNSDNKDNLVIDTWNLIETWSLLETETYIITEADKLINAHTEEVNPDNYDSVEDFIHYLNTWYGFGFYGMKTIIFI